ncbi:MAG: response regulator [bacterium]|nr:response regulator [bacterium]
MKIYLIDDDKNILNILKLIIRNQNLGEICGTATCGIDALDDFSQIHPDIIIVDLLMPEIDGIALVKKAKSLLPNTAFIMLSQVNSKDMIAEAYESGVEFYIQKPINSIEVVSVITKVSASLSAQRTLQQVQNIFMLQNTAPTTTSAVQETVEKEYITKLKGILQKLGIAGEKGCKDIITIIEYLLEHDLDLEDTTLNQLCSNFTENPKSMEQRIRRTANLGMINLAHLGLEDYYNDTFTAYAGTLYNFEQIRREMEHIRGKSFKGGNVKIKSFLNSLIIACQEA